jgi:hypothetical protein
MKLRFRRFDQRFNDPAFVGDLLKRDKNRVNAAAIVAMGGKHLAHISLDPDPRDSDGKKTVIIHGKRVSEMSPKWQWPNAELWGVTRCNVLYWRETLPDWDRWFDLHPVQPAPHHRGILEKRPEAWDWYQRQTGGRPIYLIDTDPSIPDSVAFPRDAVQRAFPEFGDLCTQFTVSVDWLIAFALMEGFERIVLNGIGTRFDPDFQYEHMGIWHWLGFARGRGVDVVIEGPSCYHQPQKVYGYEAAAPEWNTLTRPVVRAAEEQTYGIRRQVEAVR